MTWKECKKLIDSDRKRLTKSQWGGVKYLIFNASFRISFWFRIGSYLQTKRTIPYKLLYGIVFLIHKHNQYLTGIQISFGTPIKEGLMFGHFSSIVINKGCSIGKSCTIFQGVTIGSIRTNKAKNGSPIIGDNVVISPGAKIIGRITIGNNVFIAPNSVVIHNIPDNATIGGIPAKILNYNGAENCSFYTSD